MNRNATSHFDSFDPEVIEAARDVASRVGVPLESWIASVVPQHFTMSGTGQPTPPHGPPTDTVSPPRSDATDAASAEGLAALMTRIDGLDRSMEAERRAAALAEQKRLEEIEQRIDRALQTNPVQQVTERLGDIERRVAALNDQVANAKPAAKRGKATAAEMREAVQAIRQRQKELSGQPELAGTVATMHRDLARRLGDDPDAATDTKQGVSSLPAYVVEELHREAARVRDAISPLATAADITALENALESLAASIGRARSDAEVPALALPLAVIRTRLSEFDLASAEAAHIEVFAGLKRFSKRLDVAIAFEDADADNAVLTSLSTELSELRKIADDLAPPQRLLILQGRVEQLAVQIDRIPPADLSPAEPVLAGESNGAAFSGSPEHPPVELADDIHALAARMDTLRARAEVETGAKARSAAPDGEMASIRAMLHSLAEKVDRVGERNGPESLDALEKQVLTLVDKIETPHALDPALLSLERTMTDLMHQVEALRVVSPSEAVIERAARSAVVETLKVANSGGDQNELGLLRASLADMQARQIASDERLSATLEGVQSALDRLVTRLANGDAASTVRAPSLDERLMTSTSVEANRASHRPVLNDAPKAGVASSSTDILLEPGAPRPFRGAASVEKREPAMMEPTPDLTAEKAGPVDSDIKTSFIAAARRAAQAAQAELAAELPLEKPLRSGRPAAPTVQSAGAMRRLRSEIDQHRKPILLGLAAIVLTLGALQAINMRPGQDAARTPQLSPSAGTPITERPADGQKVADAVKPAEAPKSASAAPISPDPATTQAIATPQAPDALVSPAKPIIPTVPNMAGLAGDLANLPSSLAKVKQAALSGDGAAVWELAIREADGRGTARDLAGAAKLFEKLANAGYAPAQYKLGAHYEKGSGIGRDLAQAKLWYGRAAEQGHARAMHNLGVIYAENPAPGGKPDFASAASWFRQGAEHGVRDSQYNIAVLYARGMGLTQDLVQSYVWFAAAAAQGDEDAGKKRDDVATKLSAPDLARAKSLAASFKPRKLDPAVNEPPALAENGQGSVSLLGAPVPTAMGPQSAKRAI